MRSSVMRYRVVLGLVFVIIAGGAIVLAVGGRSDRLGLIAAIVTGLVVALVFYIQDISERHRRTIAMQGFLTLRSAVAIKPLSLQVLDLERTFKVEGCAYHPAVSADHTAQLADAMKNLEPELADFQSLQLALAAREALIGYGRVFRAWTELMMPYLTDHASITVVEKVFDQVEGLAEFDQDEFSNRELNNNDSRRSRVIHQARQALYRHFELLRSMEL